MLQLNAKKCGDDVIDITNNNRLLTFLDKNLIMR